MPANAVLVLRAGDVSRLLHGAEAAVMQAVRCAYEMHSYGDTVMPHSAFLRFPGRHDRIAALPAYLGGPFGVAGVKWISSFPDNIERGLERASGIVVLNSIETGRATAICEGALISATRTAASAALAASVLHDSPRCPQVGLLGCGVINFATLRFLRHCWPDLRDVVVSDLSAERVRRFGDLCEATLEGVRVHTATGPRELLERSLLVSIATTAMQPHIMDLDRGAARIILHLSLRDLAPSIIVECDNVVDDADHVCRAETSLDLAERLVGHRTFIRCALGDILTARAQARVEGTPVRIFSPFGLGILDVAVAQLVYERALERQCGMLLANFAAPFDDDADVRAGV